MKKKKKNTSDLTKNLPIEGEDPNQQGISSGAINQGDVEAKIKSQETIKAMEENGYSIISSDTDSFEFAKLQRKPSRLLNNDNMSQNKAHYLATMAIYVEDYQNAMFYAEEMAKTTEAAFTKDQQRVFICAFFNNIIPLRESWRKINYKEKEEKEGKKMLLEIKASKEVEIIRISEKIIKLINENVLKKEGITEEEIALFTKVKADYYRYMAEITHGHKLYLNKQNAFNFYKEAYEKAKNYDDLNATKLNISLNYSVFLYEIMNKRINAFFFAKESLFKALRALRDLERESLIDPEMRDTLVCVEILNRNVEEWYKEEVGDIFRMDAGEDEVKKEEREGSAKDSASGDEGERNKEMEDVVEELKDDEKRDISKDEKNENIKSRLSTGGYRSSQLSVSKNK